MILNIYKENLNTLINFNDSINYISINDIDDNNNIIELKSKSYLYSILNKTNEYTNKEIDEIILILNKSFMTLICLLSIKFNTLNNINLNSSDYDNLNYKEHKSNTTNYILQAIEGLERFRNIFNSNTINYTKINNLINIIKNNLNNINEENQNKKKIYDIDLNNKNYSDNEISSSDDSYLSDNSYINDNSFIYNDFDKPTILFSILNSVGEFIYYLFHKIKIYIY